MVFQSFLTIKKSNTTKSWSKYNLTWWSLFKLMTWESSTNNISDWNNMSNMLMLKSLLKSFISKDNKTIEPFKRYFGWQINFSLILIDFFTFFKKFWIIWRVKKRNFFFSKISEKKIWLIQPKKGRTWFIFYYYFSQFLSYQTDHL